MDKEIIITQSLDEKTLIKASIQILLSGRLIIYIVVLIIFVIINVITGLHDFGDTPPDVFTFIPFLIPIIVFFGVWHSTRKTVIRNYKKNPRYYNNITFTLTPEGLNIQGEEFNNKNQWENYYKIKEREKWFLIFIDRHQAHIIDKAQLKSYTTEDLRMFFRQLPPKVKVAVK